MQRRHTIDAPSCILVSSTETVQLRVAEAILGIWPLNRYLGIVLKRVLGLLLSYQEEVVEIQRLGMVILASHVCRGALLRLTAKGHRWSIDDFEFAPDDGQLFFGTSSSIAHRGNHLQTVSHFNGRCGSSISRQFRPCGTANVAQRVVGLTLALAFTHVDDTLPPGVRLVLIVGIPLHIVGSHHVIGSVIDIIVVQGSDLGTQRELTRAVIGRYHDTSTVLQDAGHIGLVLGLNLGLHGCQVFGCGPRLCCQDGGWQDMEQIALGDGWLMDKIGERVVHTVKIARHVASYQYLPALCQRGEARGGLELHTNAPTARVVTESESHMTPSALYQFVADGHKVV